MQPLSRKLAKFLPYGLIGLFLLLFFAASVTGPDFDHYLRWARAFDSADTTAFWDKGHTLSPLGVPLTQWSHGPGLIFASLCPAGCRNFMSMQRQAIVAGMLFSVALWWALFRLLRRAGSGDVQWAVYGVTLAILGTHLGFYSRSYASETFSQATLALLAMWVVTRAKWRRLDALVVGCLAGLLVISRSQLLIYTLPFLGVMYWSAWKTAGPKKPLQSALFVGLSLLPLGIALVEVGMTNRWMTGSWLGSPYSFGDAVFRSLDFTRPELRAVLLHPWHGLLTHHPLYAVGFAALLLLIVQSHSLPERLFWLSCAVAIVLHVYLQAAWYVWWLGMQTFGMRGLGISAVILVPALIHTMRRRELQGKGYAIWAALALACCLWSAPLFMENLYAETQFFTYAELFSQYRTLAAPLAVPLALTAVMIAIAFLFARAGERTDATGLRGRFASQLRRRPALSISLMLLAPITLYCLTAYVVAQASGRNVVQAAPLAMAPLGVAFTSIFLATSAEPFARDTMSPAPTRRSAPETFVSVALLTLFGVSALLFARLARNTERMIADQAWPVEGIRYVSAVHVDEVAESYLEYLNVPGFDAKRADLKAYVEELMACAAVSSAEDVLPRVIGPPRTRAEAHTPFGTDLLLTEVGLSGGAGREGTTFRAGEFLGVQTRWQVMNAMVPQKFSLRVEDAERRRWAAADYEPQVGCADGEMWQPDADEIDQGGIPLPPDLPPGPYTLRLVVYDPETGEVLPTEDEQSAALASINVAAAAMAPNPDDLPITVRVNAPAGDGLQVIGYSLEPDPIQAGSEGTLKLWWRAQQPPQQATQVRIEIVDGGGATVSETVYPLGTAPAEIWRAGQIVGERYPLVLEPGIAAGDYRLRLAPEASDGRAIIPAINLGEVYVEARPRSYDLPPMEHSLGTTLGKEIKLRGYSMEPPPAGSDVLTLTLYWQALARIAGQYRVFVHLVDDEGSIVAQRDTDPLDGAAPTRSWLAGEVVTDVHTLAVPQGGPYRLIAGMYDPATGERLPVINADGQLAPESGVELGTVSGL